MDRIRHASWQNRFWAWVIDVLLISLLWYSIMYAFNLDATSFLGLGCYGFMTFVYWTFLEGYRGQSLGKMVLNLAVAGQFGERITLKNGELRKVFFATD